MSKQTRYFKATDGTFTVYRSTQSRDYRSAYFSHSHSGNVTGIAFSAKPARGGMMEAFEITPDEYKALVACKADRCKRDGVKYPEVPGQSWVRNADIVAAPQCPSCGDRYAPSQCFTVNDPDVARELRIPLGDEVCRECYLGATEG
jgi:hypothetical protein